MSYRIGDERGRAIPTLADWLRSATVGSTFTIGASLKGWGLERRIEGAAVKAFTQRLCGTGPAWNSRLAFPFFSWALVLPS
jgi:hypothetical protein